MQWSRAAAFLILTGLFGHSLLLACGLDRKGEVTVTVAPDRGVSPGLDGSADRAGDEALPEAAVESGPSCPAGMVEASTFCIDRTEVTNAAYAEFLDATAGDASFLSGDADAAGVPAWCRKIATLEPPYSEGSEDAPVMYVSWCDAYAYCFFSQKRLCEGGDSGEWTRACTRDGSQKLPYGDVPEAGVCNVGKPATPFAQHTVGSSMCNGGYDGIVDLVGNVEEWVLDCTSDGSACAAAGGWWGSPSSTTCHATNRYPPESKGSGSYGIGFRCCR